jgi:hypothetical protein
VRPAALCGGRRREDRRREERVRERNQPSLAFRDLRALGRFEVASDRTAERDPDGFLPGIVQCRSRQQYLARCRGQLPYASFHERSDVARDGQRLTRRRHADLLEQPTDLQREQWIPSGGGMDAHEHRA